MCASVASSIPADAYGLAVEFRGHYSHPSETPSVMAATYVSSFSSFRLKSDLNAMIPWVIRAIEEMDRDTWRFHWWTCADPGERKLVTADVSKAEVLDWVRSLQK